MTPETDASVLSQLTFWWYTPLLRKGYYNALVHDDLPPVRFDDTAKRHAQAFENAWEHEEQLGRRSLVRALFAAYWKRFLSAGLFKIGNDIFIFTGPVILQQIVIFMQRPDWDVWMGVLLAFAMFVGTEIQSLSMQQYWQRVYRISMNIYTALTTKTYSKALRISHRERQKSTVGEIMNLQSVDSKSLSAVVIFLHQLWSAPLQIIVSIALLWNVLGYASFGGIAVLILTSPTQILIGRVMAGLQRDIMKKKDARIKTTNEVMQGIRVLKFFAWETSFGDKIKEQRWAELTDLRTSQFIRAGIMLIWNMTPLFVTIVSFGIYVALGYELTAEKAFAALALFGTFCPFVPPH
jgi:ATP-binding cassette subfamily C (CFTR/MRP) protein 1